jgi:hypothetical protein
MVTTSMNHFNRMLLLKLLLPPLHSAAFCCPCSTWWQRCRMFLEHLAADEAYADRAAHLANKWCAIVQLFGYNAAAVLIFALS